MLYSSRCFRRTVPFSSMRCCRRWQLALIEGGRERGTTAPCRPPRNSTRHNSSSCSTVISAEPVGFTDTSSLAFFHSLMIVAVLVALNEISRICIKNKIFSRFFESFDLFIDFIDQKLIFVIIKNFRVYTSDLRFEMYSRRVETKKRRERERRLNR